MTLQRALWMHIQRYLLSLPSSLFIPAINLSKPEIILWTLGPHTSPECPSRQRETLPGTCTALVTGRSARVRYIRVVTVYVTWHVLWRKQLDVNDRHRGGSNYGRQAYTFRIKRFHNGSCAVGVSLFTDHHQFLGGKGQRISQGISTCITNTETTNRISHHFCFQNHFNIEISCNQIHICPNILQQRMQWVVLNIQCILLDDFLMA